MPRAMGGDGEDAFVVVLSCALMAGTFWSLWMVARAFSVQADRARASTLGLPTTHPGAPPTAPEPPKTSTMWRAVHQPGGEPAVACVAVV